MWPAKLPGEGANLVTACQAMCDVMGKLGIAIDGGKDSLSMAARFGEETIKAPGLYLLCEICECPLVLSHIQQICSRQPSRHIYSKSI